MNLMRMRRHRSDSLAAVSIASSAGRRSFAAKIRRPRIPPLFIPRAATSASELGQLFSGFLVERRDAGINRCARGMTTPR